MVFYGEYLVSSSGANRFVLPKKIRELLKGDIFILTKGFDFCLNGYDREDWEKRINNLFFQPLISKEQLEKQRFIFSSMSYTEIDNQGRFVIPKSLLQFSSVKDKAIIIGVGDHFEIWNENKWRQYEKKLFPNQ